MEELYRSQFRFPYSLYEQLKRSADANHRSVNAELVARLESTFAEPVKPDPAGSSADLLISARAVIEQLADLVEQQAERPPKK